MSPPSRESSLTYLDTTPAVDDFLASIADTRELALDTEGASFHRFVDRIYLLQLSTRERSAIIDPLPIGSPAALGRLIEDPAVEIVFHDADYDLRLLHQDYGWRATNIFDTRIAAQLLGFKAFGLAALLERYFGVKLDKKHQRADWSLRPLTPGMLDYAAQDTRYLLDLRDRLTDALVAAGRWSWATEEFARLVGTRWEPEDTAVAWMRIKGARDLNRREMAVFREVVRWRDGVAAVMDRATFRVVSNDTLLTLAREVPRTREALAAVRGMPRGMVDSRSADIVAAIEAGMAVPDAALPRFPKAPRWERDPDFDGRVARLKAVRDEAAERLALDPGVLCSRERMEAVARAKPATLDALLQIPDLRRWQADILGPAFLALVAESPAAAAPSPASDPVPDDSPYRPG